jgi:hypothetical protein
VGYVGPNAFGRSSKLHKLVGYKEVLGWENQIQNSLAIQTHVLYSKSCLQVVLANQ